MKEWVASIEGKKYKEVVEDESLRDEIIERLGLEEKVKQLIAGRLLPKSYSNIMEMYVYRAIARQQDYSKRNINFIRALKNKKSINSFTMKEIFHPEIDKYIWENHDKTYLYVSPVSLVPSGLEKIEVIKLLVKYGYKESTIKKWMQENVGKIKLSNKYVGRKHPVTVKTEDMIRLIGGFSEVHLKLLELASTDSSTINTEELRAILGEKLFD
ncbi:hypothetical protein [Paenibacillus sp. FSL R7-0272]|uniref:hypothetical protein n=1 Tax=Paenibacillus sp. FSL R7-0272 TaxID=2921679 RepID=UPI0030DB785D